MQQEAREYSAEPAREAPEAMPPTPEVASGGGASMAGLPQAQAAQLGGAAGGAGDCHARTR